MDVKEMYPLSEQAVACRLHQLERMKQILDGRSSQLLVLVGPCSADSEVAVLSYMEKLRKLADEVKDKLLIVPRVYTNKPRTTGDGYKGMLHQPDPLSPPDILQGLYAIRRLHMRCLEEYGFAPADEMLYPEDHRYLSDVLSYVAVGARSVENQQHRLVASGLDIPVGMKNPTSGNLHTMLHSITAAQHSHRFLYRGWEVESHGNPYAHGILRGGMNTEGVRHPNYDTDSLLSAHALYAQTDACHPALLIDTNHDNSGKNFALQGDIVLSVMKSRAQYADIRGLVKGFMIESYLYDGACSAEAGHPLGTSITDPCLGWEKTRELLLKLADNG